jgi:hypothetical protein
MMSDSMSLVYDEYLNAWIDCSDNECTAYRSDGSKLTTFSVKAKSFMVDDTEPTKGDKMSQWKCDECAYGPCVEMNEHMPRYCLRTDKYLDYNWQKIEPERKEEGMKEYICVGCKNGEPCTLGIVGGNAYPDICPFHSDSINVRWEKVPTQSGYVAGKRIFEQKEEDMNEHIVRLYPVTEDAVLIEKHFNGYVNGFTAVLLEDKRDELLAAAKELEEKEEKE